MLLVQRYHYMYLHQLLEKYTRYIVKKKPFPCLLLLRFRSSKLIEDTCAGYFWLCHIRAIIPFEIMSTGSNICGESAKKIKMCGEGGRQIFSLPLPLGSQIEYSQGIRLSWTLRTHFGPIYGPAYCSPNISELPLWGYQTGS